MVSQLGLLSGMKDWGNQDPELLFGRSSQCTQRLGQCSGCPSRSYEDRVAPAIKTLDEEPQTDFKMVIVLQRTCIQEYTILGRVSSTAKG